MSTCNGAKQIPKPLTRTTRKRYRPHSEGDVYHVTFRGVAQQVIFEDGADHMAMHAAMRRYIAREGEIEILAWCFMSNHVHLLLRGQLDRISRAMALLQSRYARAYNERHGRQGHLFQERFSSSPVDSDEYLMTAVRYIHQNPFDSGIHDLSSYRWSSFREYLFNSDVCSTSFVLAVFGGIDRFLEFHNAPNTDQEDYASTFEESPSREASSDAAMIDQAKVLLNISDLAEIAKAAKPLRDSMLVTLKQHMSVRQIARITGLGRGVVQRAK